jgi:putative SOS response-associated peptidase YedK
MCGRFSLTTPLEGLRALFLFEESPNLPARWNIAPTQQVAAVRADDEGARHLVMLRWGLVPGWARELAVGARMINARSEGVAEKPAFRQAFARRRCLIAADGFYEWQTQGKGPKQPFRFEFEGRRPFAFAGLWERWRDPADAILVETCSILTTAASAVLAPIHDRMPAILEPADFAAWLAPTPPPAALQGLLRPYPASGGYGPLSAYAISTLVNKVANDGPALAEPLERGGPQKTLF